MRKEGILVVNHVKKNLKGEIQQDDSVKKETMKKKKKKKGKNKGGDMKCIVIAQ